MRDVARVDDGHMVFFVGGILNSIQLGTRMWLYVVDALGYLPAAYAVSRLLRK